MSRLARLLILMGWGLSQPYSKVHFSISTMGVNMKGGIKPSPPEAKEFAIKGVELFQASHGRQLITTFLKQSEESGAHMTQLFFSNCKVLPLV